MPEQTEVFPGVLRHVEYRIAVYVGRARPTSSKNEQGKRHDAN